MGRSRGSAWWVGVALALAALAAPAAAVADGGAKAKITRSAGGIPTIEAKNWKGLGFGYGYAFAQDNICTIADTYLTSAAERSRWFGPDAETPEGFTNLDSDLFYQQVRDRGIVEELVAQPPPAGPKGAVEQGVEGYVEGYNRYLEKTGVENIPDSRCAGEPWVRPIDKWDVYRRFYELVLYASSGVAIDGIAGAQPPAAAPRPAAYERAEAATAEVTAAERGGVEELGEAFDLSADIGSNAWGLGSEATESGGGIVLGNPHFPWDGPRRFYQSHLVIPGKVNVSGASLFGVPLILIGHTEKLAWSHTVSTAYRFTPFELTLAPGDPTSYLVDGQPVAMEADEVTVEVKQPDGSIAAPEPDPVRDPLRPDHDLDPGPVAVRMDAEHRLRAVRRQRGQHAHPQPLLRDQPRPVDQGPARDPARVPGDPVGEHDRRRLQGAGALCRHRLDPQRPEREGDRLLGNLRPGHLPGPRPAGARRLALGVRPRHRRRLARRGDHGRLADAAARAPRLRRQRQRLLLADEPRAAARGLRADHRRASGPSARCGPASG